MSVKWCPDLRRYIDDAGCNARKAALRHIRPDMRGKVSCDECGEEMPEPDLQAQLIAHLVADDGQNPLADDDTGTKTCARCGGIFPILMFSRCQSSRDGRQPYCKECDLIRQREWRAAHKAKMRHSDAAMPKDTKICTKCRRELPLSAFHKHSYNVDGLQCHCKECRSQVDKKYRERLKSAGAMCILSIMLAGMIYSLMTGAADQQARLESEAHRLLGLDATVVAVAATAPPSPAELRRHGVLWARYDRIAGRWYTERKDGRIWLGNAH